MRKEKESLRAENEFLVIKQEQELGSLKLQEDVNVCKRVLQGEIRKPSS